TRNVLGQDIADLDQQVMPPALFQLGFQLIGLVEMILDRALVAAGDKYHMGNAGSDRLVHSVLNEGLVHDREHLFGGRLGRRQKAGAQARDGEYGFGDSSQFTTSSLCVVAFSCRRATLAAPLRSAQERQASLPFRTCSPDRPRPRRSRFSWKRCRLLSRPRPGCARPLLPARGSAMSRSTRMSCRPEWYAGLSSSAPSI